jgi:hypothetical protein
MAGAPRQASPTIAAVLADVDGTLVTKDKVLTPRTMKAFAKAIEQFVLPRAVPAPAPAPAE